MFTCRMSQTGARSAFSPFATRSRMSCSSLADMLGRDLQPALLLLQRAAGLLLHVAAKLAAAPEDGTKASGRDTPRASRIAA